MPRLQLTQLASDDIRFPAIELALPEPNGLLAWGGDLSPQRLLHAYQQGIFPWFSADEPPLWWCPDPRAVLWPARLHRSRSLQRFLRQHHFTITINHDFAQVIQRCARVDDPHDCWLTPAMISAYQQLHQLGHAHSLEVWQQDQLIGGLYGVAQGAIFCAESMFSQQTNGSKVALSALCDHFLRHGGLLIDCQVLNSHTQSLGVIEIARHQYLLQLKLGQQQPLATNCWKKQQFPLAIQ